MQRRGDGEGGSANEGRPGVQGRGGVFCVSCLCGVVLHLKKGGTGTTVSMGGAAGNDSAAPPTASCERAGSQLRGD